MDVTVYTNGEQYYYDSDLKSIITKGNLKALMDQPGVNFKVVDMSLYKEQHRGYLEDPDNPVFEQNLYIAYNPDNRERVHNRIFASDGAVVGGGQDSSYQFDFEKVRYEWPERDYYLNETIKKLFEGDVPVHKAGDINFNIELKEDTDFPTIEIMDDQKAFSHLVRLSKGMYNFHVRFTPNMIGTKHNYDSEGAIKRCNDLRIICSRGNYIDKVKDWKNVNKVFTLGFNDELQMDFVTVINTRSSIDNPGNSRIASSSRHLNDRNIEFDDMLDYVNTYSNNTRAGRRR